MVLCWPGRVLILRVTLASPVSFGGRGEEPKLLSSRPSELTIGDSPVLKPRALLTAATLQDPSDRDQ